MNMNRIAILAVSVLVASCCATPEQEDVFTVGAASSVYGLHAPWDGLDDDTVFHCFADDETFYFQYIVNDSTITLEEPYVGEVSVEREDRVEIFFSARREMDVYYCAEIDPLGRVLDYSSRYYREMDYDWDFETMELWGAVTGNGYVVGGSVKKSELVKLGMDLNSLYMGVFRADFRPDLSVNWYSHVETDDESPDFHKPDVLFHAKMN